MHMDLPESRVHVELCNGCAREEHTSLERHGFNACSAEMANDSHNKDARCPAEDLVKEISTEEIFNGNGKVPSWREQITTRGLSASLVIGIMFSIIVMRINLTTGLAPTMNVPAGLFGFVFMRTWTKILERARLLKTPFTKQENTIIQTCVVACYGLAHSGGFASYLLGMNKYTYDLAGGAHTEGNTADTIKEPSPRWMIGYCLLVSFIGILTLVPLRKCWLTQVMIIDYRLTYPSGTATAVLINGFHTPQGDKQARKQVRCFGKYFMLSFLWGIFKWFYTGGENCGFTYFPTFGLRAWEQKFYFDFNMTYVGAGMICPHLVNISLLLGAIISWGLMWPLIANRKGDWYSEKLPDSSMKGLQGYKVFICIALILGDGIYNFVKIMCITLATMYVQWKMRKDEIALTSRNVTGAEEPAKAVTYDQELRDEMFMKDSIPGWIAGTGYVALATISICAIPHMFPHVKWYYVFLGYIIAPVLAFCNSYGTGLTDMNLSYNYGKVALFVFAAWAGKDHGGVIVGLAVCGVLKSMLSAASDLMQDFKTGYVTLSSPRSMFISQLIGAAMGSIVGPLTFWLFYKTFEIGNPDGEYKAPFALIYRNMAILGVEGFSALPKHCLQLCYSFFVLAIVLNVIRDRLPKEISRYIPLPMAMGVPFLVGGYFTIDMCVGTAFVFISQKINRRKADVLMPAVATGLICGEGICILPYWIFSLIKVQAPICMKFLSRHTNQNVDKYLGL